MHIPGRRHFLKNVAILAPIFTLLPSHVLATGGSRLRIGFVGLGPWGRQYLAYALQHEQLNVKAICEPNKRVLAESLQLFNTLPDIEDYETLLARKDIDAVVIGTPWDQHYEMAKAAMLAGKHVACGPVMGTTVEEHWNIVQTSERTGCQYFTLDESNYRADLMAVSNIDLGQLETICAGAHYDVLQEAHQGAALPYPLYPATAVARVMGISKENAYTTARFEKREEELIVRKTHLKTGKPYINIKREEIDTIILTTTNRQEVLLQAGRCGNGEEQPASMGFRIKGSAGRWMDFSGSLYSPATQAWTPLALSSSLQKSPVTQALQEFINTTKQPASRSVYAAATNSVIGTLAALSAARNGAAVNFPDFKG